MDIIRTNVASRNAPPSLRCGAFELRRRSLPNELRREPLLCDAFALCDRLGWIGGKGSFARQSGGVIILCPWHEERTPSCSVRLGNDGTIFVRCHGCGATGDALALIAAANHWNTARDFPRVLQYAAELTARYDLLEYPERPHRSAPSAPPPAPVSNAHVFERNYPDEDAIAKVWSSAGFVANDAAAVAMLAGRHLDVEAIDDRDLARTLSIDTALPQWARWQRQSWLALGHRLVLPVYDELGHMRSLRAWRLPTIDTAERTPDSDAPQIPKRLPPGGYRATGLVLADPFAVAMLEHDERLDGTPAPLAVVIVEGEPDFLTWATRFSDADEEAPIVLGVPGSGSWSDAIAARIPDGSHVVIRTDHDVAGNSYAATIGRSLARRCRLERSRPTFGERRTRA